MYKGISLLYGGILDMGKNQSKVGVKKDYGKMYTQMQKDFRGVKPEVKKEYYKDFYIYV